jgi:hypothetical protein
VPAEPFDLSAAEESLAHRTLVDGRLLDVRAGAVRETLLDDRQLEGTVQQRQLDADAPFGGALVAAGGHVVI